ncbi:MULTISPECIES: GntR family transcriptional regulator [unclassified Streptomyces]|uniref:GntR family transcriptional regulator n=1 Tax=unclassified Streptomyces TaxID=2593676 RepID=UPI00224E98C7|nr:MULTISPECIES: GntR family transcriptional regulator [unclassified Streptomyces]MCX4629231.1 GntR family transcriptional regulator [Streptomyces sp. NBC_01443]
MPETARQIADDLRARIDSGEFGPGARLPGEPALVKQYGVAKMTAANALKLLVTEGAAYARPGSGTYVRDFTPIRRVATRRLSRSQWSSGSSVWAADVSDRAMEVVDIEVYETATAPHWVTRALHLEQGESVLIRGRRYVVDGSPVQQATSYFAADSVRDTPIAQPDPGPGGVYARLADLGMAPADFTEELRARMPSSDEVELLALLPATPVVEIYRTAMTAEGKPVEVNHMLLDAGSYVMQYDFTS